MISDTIYCSIISPPTATSTLINGGNFMNIRWINSGDEDADCERSDTDQSEKVFYPPTNQTDTPSAGGSSFSVKMGLQNSLSQPSSGGSSGFVDLVEARRRLRSRGGPKDLQQGNYTFPRYSADLSKFEY